MASADEVRCLQRRGSRYASWYTTELGGVFRPCERRDVIKFGDRCFQFRVHALSVANLPRSGREQVIVFLHLSERIPYLPLSSLRYRPSSLFPLSCTEGLLKVYVLVLLPRSCLFCPSLRVYYALALVRFLSSCFPPRVTSSTLFMFFCTFTCAVVFPFLSFL